MPNRIVSLEFNVKSQTSHGGKRRGGVAHSGQCHECIEQSLRQDHERKARIEATADWLDNKLRHSWNEQTMRRFVKSRCECDERVSDEDTPMSAEHERRLSKTRTWLRRGSPDGGIAG